MDPELVSQAKRFAMQVTHLSQDALHVYVGLLLLVGLCVALRKPLGSWLPWVVVLAAALAGEAVDMRGDFAHNGIWNWHESLHDVLNTIFWPTVLSVLGRLGWLPGSHRSS